MKFNYYFVKIFILSFNFLFGVSSIIENHSIFYPKISVIDTANKENISFDYNYQNTFKSPGKALLLSGFLPGAGQFYMKEWMRGLIFIALDGLAISTWYFNKNLAEDKKNEYAKYAIGTNGHWEFSRWIHDYYKWYEYDSSNPSSNWNEIRKVFTNYTDTLGQCDDVSQPKCYTDIWEHSHSVEFTWDTDGDPSTPHEIIKSNEEEKFKDVYIYLCASNQNQTHVPTGRVCEVELEEVKDRLSMRSNGVIYGHHFFEGIQKYDMYFSGWVDNDSVTVVTTEHGDINASSPNQIKYRNIWTDYNKIKTLSGNGGKFMLINRLISMVDAVLLAKKWNTEDNFSVSINAYPDLRNKSGLGGIRLSFLFK